MNFLSNPDYDVNGTLFYKALKKYIKSLKCNFPNKSMDE